MAAYRVEQVLLKQGRLAFEELCDKSSEVDAFTNLHGWPRSKAFEFVGLDPGLYMPDTPAIKYLPLPEQLDAIAEAIKSGRPPRDRRDRETAVDQTIELAGDIPEDQVVLPEWLYSAPT